MAEQNYIRGATAVKIAESVETAIMRGTARAGDPLPTVRALAARLDVSAATVAAAYAILRTRGLATADGRRGTRICAAPPLSAPRPLTADGAVTDLSDGNPDPRLLPSLRTALRAIDPEPRLYPDVVKLPRLVSLAQAQFEDDGLNAGSLTISGGALDGIERVLRERLRPGDRVAVEDPCFTGVSDLLSSLALAPAGFEVDDDGPVAGPFERALRGAKAVIVTPRAQNPTGAALSARRARELSAVVRRHPELLVIEDDHAGSIAGAPYRTLTTHAKSWAVVRSVSKSLGPDLRLAFLAGDALTIARVEGRQLLGVRWVSHILQEIVAGLLESDVVKRNLERARDEYASRRSALLTALAAEGIAAHGNSGLNVWIPVEEEAATVAALYAAGWSVAPGERYRLTAGPAIRVTTARLAPADARRFAAALGKIVRGAGAPRV